MDSLSPQRILHKPMTVLQVARQVFPWLLRKKKFHYYANTIHILYMRFCITKMTFVIGDSLSRSSLYN
jgi:hypothetical protein